MSVKIKYYPIFIALLCLFSCNIKKGVQEEVYHSLLNENIEIFINDTRNLPPPPQIGQNDTIPPVNKKIKDKRPLLLIIQKNLFEPTFAVNKNSIPDDFKNIFKSNLIETKNLPIKKNDVVKVNDSIYIYVTEKANYKELKKTYKKKGFYINGYVRMSKLIFNNNQTYCYMEATYNRSGLDGTEFAIFLKKINKNWKVVKSVLISIS